MASPTSHELDVAFELLNRELATGDYWERRLALRRRIKPPAHRFLYKYMGVTATDETSIDRLRDIVVRGRLWMAAAADFNDPFDLACAVVVDGTRKQIHKRMRTLIRANERGGHKARRLKLAQMKQLPVDEIQHRTRLAVDRARRETGIVSLTTKPRNIQMWSHYAAQHQGVCVQLELARDPSLLHAVAVEYADDFPTINYVRDTGPQVLALVLRKQTGWAYEDERRIVAPGGAHDYFRFDPDATTAVILGCRCTEGVQEVVRQLMREREAAGRKAGVVYQAEQHPRRYALNVRRSA